MPGARSTFHALGISDSGVTALEYALILALIAVASITAIFGVGDRLEKNLDIVVAAITDDPVPEADTAPPSEDETLAETTPPTPSTDPSDDTPRSGDGGGGTGGDGEPLPATGQAGTNPSSGGNGKVTGGEAPIQAAASPTFDSAAANGSAENSSGGVSPPGGGIGAGSTPPGGDENPGVFGWDSTFRGHAPGLEGPSGTSPAGFAMIGGSTAGGSAGNNPSAGTATSDGGGESATKSALILLMWLLLAICIAILGWKIALDAAAKKDAKEELEDWKPASFGT